MTYTLLHLSDLHRAQTEPIGNAELLSTLVADRARAAREEPPIPAPDVIIVTGDLVQGARLGLPDHEAELDAQYAVASDFLASLAEHFLDGDRARLVVVPGNHDVDWNRSRAAMAEVAEADLPRGFSPAMCGPTDDLRWNWIERRAYRIVDHDMYAERLARFDALVDAFYTDADLVRGAHYRMHPLLDERIAIVAFNSCVGNDCFADHGAIAEDAVANAHLALQHTPYELHIAAWHHSIAGEPAATDYMSVSTVDRLIGKGFRLGLHGHQHRAAAANRYIHLPQEEVMAVVSAGSLCAGTFGLPTGVNRQYNVIELSDDLSAARVHVREMAIATNFAPARRAELGFSSHVDLKWTLPADGAQRRAEHERHLTLEAERANAEQRFADAEGILGRVSRPPGSYARSLLVIALREQHAWHKLATELQEPHSIEELVAGTDALARSGEHDQADAYLGRHAAALRLPRATAGELRAMITARRGMA
jgi:predicted MPP superfamily phosphohydrolase